MGVQVDAFVGILSHAHKASEVVVKDSADYFTESKLEGVLAEIGSTLATITNPLLFKGVISLASDFPTSAAVQTGWFYRVLATVTDNDVTKTNTGQVFVSGDEIAWNGTNWTEIGSATIPWGSLTGTLSDQADLQSALDLKLENVVEDLTPQLGGELDANGNDILLADSASALKSGNYPVYAKSFNTGVGAPPSEAMGSIISYWKMDEGTGVSVGDSVALNDGTLVGGTWVGDGVFGYVGDDSLSFANTSEYVSVATDATLNFGTNDFTCAFWLTAEIGTGASKIYATGKTDANGNGWGFWYSEAPVDGYYAMFWTVSGDGANYKAAVIDDADYIVDGTAKLIGLVRSGAAATDLSIFVDGVDRASNYIDQGAGVNVDTAVAYLIGFSLSEASPFGSIIEDSFDVSLASIFGQTTVPQSNGEVWGNPFNGGSGGTPQNAGTNVSAGNLSAPSGSTGTTEHTNRIDLKFSEQRAYASGCQLGSGNARIVGLRYSATTLDGYSIYVTSTTAFIFKWVSGAATTLGSVAGSFSGTINIEGIATGTTITANITGSDTKSVSVSDATFASNTRVGVGVRRAAGGTPLIANFLAEEYVP